MKPSEELSSLSDHIRNNSFLTTTQRTRIADLLGLLGLIHKELDGQIWNPETPAEIAAYMEAQGLEIAEPTDEDHCVTCGTELSEGPELLSGTCDGCMRNLKHD